MAIIYSYPHATPTISDMVLGAKFHQNEGISTNSFYISELINLIGTTTETYTESAALTSANLNALYPQAMIGFKVQATHPDLLLIYEKTATSDWLAYNVIVA